MNKHEIHICLPTAFQLGDGRGLHLRKYAQKNNTKHTFDKRRQNAYNIGMSAIQYTIRSVPNHLDAFLRHQAALHGKSLNQTVLDYIKLATKLDMQDNDDDFGWIIGANTLDYASTKAITEFKKVDKRKSHIRI
jgi:hypothetical protein